VASEKTMVGSETSAPPEPRADEWQPWTLAGRGEFLPPPPSSDTLQVSRDDRQKAEHIYEAAAPDARSRAVFWDSPAGVFDYWYTLAAQKMAEYHLDSDALRAARIYALISVAHEDAANACWHAMIAYRVLRPAGISAATLMSIFLAQTPGYPSLPACLAGAMSGILGDVFLADAAQIGSTAEEAAQAGLWTSASLPSHVAAGYTLGRVVALRVQASPRTWIWGE
jgi:hypothetical protein